MENIAILDGFFGDCGKGKISHWFNKTHSVVAKFSGSLNAGHTIYDDGRKIVRRLLPCTDFNDLKNSAFLGCGMVIDIDELVKEVQATEDMFPGSGSRITVDPDAFAILPHHIEEDKVNIIKYGSTGKGVSPAYRDKTNRIGIKLFDLIKDNHPGIIKLKLLGVQFKTVLEMREIFKKKSIIFEGNQSVLLDINAGTYPYVTSGECTLGGIFNSGFAWAMPKTVYGIVKAYSTRVGEGPYPTEIFGKEAEDLRIRGNEYGSVTSRPRRIGWLDLPALRYAKAKGGITDLIITKLDILNGMDQVPICDSYNKEPMSGRDFFTAKANFVNIKGWKDAKDIKQIKPFIDFVHEQTDLPVKYISCGVNKEDLIKIS